MSGLRNYLFAALGFAWLVVGIASTGSASEHWTEAPIAGTSPDAVVLGRDLDGDGDPDEGVSKLPTSPEGRLSR